MISDREESHTGMDMTLFGIWLVTYLVGAVWYILYLMHMFQQNSYKPREYLEWMRVHSNVGRLLHPACSARKYGLPGCGMCYERNDCIGQQTS